MARPTKDDPRNQTFTMRISDEDRAFIERVKQDKGIRTSASAAYRIFECGKQFFDAECSNNSTIVDVSQDGGAS